MENQHKHTPSCHVKQKFDYLLWTSLSICTVGYIFSVAYHNNITDSFWIRTFTQSIYDLINTMWIGIILGMVMVSLLSKIPREFIISILGGNSGIGGIMRATLGGVLLDLCSHGILMVGAKLYERGASAGQVMAFLVASPWNSFSLTLILISLIGLPWTLSFIALSLLIAIITGLIFDALVARKILPSNPNNIQLEDNFQFWKESRQQLSATKYNKKLFKDLLFNGFKESRMVLRWIFFGVILASLIRAFVDAGNFQTYFGPTIVGLGLTIFFATIIEVCSEGSVPIAADLFTRANSPGNSFAFLMTGVSTDYTEIMILRDTTKSWKVSLFLPLVTIPQIILLSWLINTYT